MKKLEFIEKYGEEAWKKHLESVRKSYQKNKEKKKQYRLDNKEKFAEYQKQYRLENKEQIAEKKRQWYQNNKEVLFEKYKQYRLENKEQILEKKKVYQKQYRQTNKEYIIEYQKQYRQTPEGRASIIANAYKQIDKEKGFDTSNNITQSYILQRIFTSKCVYCGDSDWEHLGADRIDNSKGHTPDNVVCACGICNEERSDRMSFHDFMEYRKTHPRYIGPQWSPLEKTETGAIKKRVRLF